LIQLIGDFMIKYRILDKNGNILYRGTTKDLDRRIREYEGRGLPDGWTVETD
jgi:predicted GIY-YIG superfamily endonuclease